MSVRGRVDRREQASRVVDERLDVAVEDVVEDVEALRRCAYLSGIEVGRPRSALRRDVEPIGDVRADDERILSAELEIDAGDALRATHRDSPAGFDGAGEGDAVDSLVADDRLADVARTSEQVHGTGRKVIEALRKHQG
jgi:hypothetical protein